MATDDINPNGEHVNNAPDDKAAFNKVIDNLSVEVGDGESVVGAGYLAKHVSRADDAKGEKEKKKRRESKAHHAFLKQLQNRINELQAQIKVLQGKIDGARERQTEIKGELTKNKERMEELQLEGKTGSQEYLDLIARNQLLVDEDSDLDKFIDGLNDKKRGLQKDLDELQGRFKDVVYPEEQQALMAGVDFETSETSVENRNEFLAYAAYQKADKTVNTSKDVEIVPVEPSVNTSTSFVVPDALGGSSFNIPLAGAETLPDMNSHFSMAALGEDEPTTESSFELPEESIKIFNESKFVLPT